ncbi:MAG: hypothetical protein ACF8PN_12640 [Phycisphaerales bacterium]
MPSFSEQDLAAHVVSWLERQGWDVYQEVKAGPFEGRIADIVAVRGAVVWVVECKRSLNLQVIAQADDWPVVRRSIAIPALRVKRKDRLRAFAERACARFEIGVLEVGLTGSVVRRVPAPIRRAWLETSRKLREQLDTEHKSTAPAGLAAGPRWTPYRRTMREALRVIRERPGITIAELMSVLESHHYPTDFTARRAIARSLDEHEEWCFVERSLGGPRFYHLDDRPDDLHGGYLFDLTAPLDESA